MKIKRLNHKLVYEENGKQVSLTGYAFLDEMNHTMIIVYGESKMKLINDYFP